MFFFLSFETQISLETLFDRTPYIYYACSNFILFLKNEFNMNRVETCMHNKCMGLYGNLTKKRAKKEEKISLLGVAPRTTHLQNHLFFFFAMHGCALAEPGGPWRLPFALW